MFQLPHVREKTLQNIWTEDIRKKRTKTNFERYGGNTPASSEKVRNKMKNTCLERYGAETYIQSEEGRKVNIQVKKIKEKGK